MLRNKKIIVVLLVVLLPVAAWTQYSAYKKRQTRPVAIQKSAGPEKRPPSEKAPAAGPAPKPGAREEESRPEPARTDAAPPRTLLESRGAVSGDPFLSTEEEQKILESLRKAAMGEIREPAPAQEVSLPVLPKPVDLKATFVDGKHRMALVENLLLREGSRFGQERVLEIGDGWIVMEHLGMRRTVALGGVVLEDHYVPARPESGTSWNRGFAREDYRLFARPQR